MQVNTSKSETCVFTINNHLRTLRSFVVLPDEILKFNEKLKYLDVILESLLWFHKHIESIKTRVKKGLNILKCILGKGRGASAKTLKIKCTTLVKPLSQYDSPLWQASRTSVANWREYRAMQLKLFED